MSSPQPPAPRRRRIAGERRGRTFSTDHQGPLDERTTDADAEEPRGLLVTDSPEGRDDETLFEFEDEPDTTERRSSGWWGSRLCLMTLAALLAVLLVLTGLTALGLTGTDGIEDVNEAQDVQRATRTAPAAAEAAAAAILAYDFRSLDADQDSAVRFMTREFAQEYSDTFEKVVRSAAEDTRARVTATVQASGVIQATEDTARVLLFVDQATVSTSNEQPQIALNRVEMSLVREGDSWLVDDISSY